DQAAQVDVPFRLSLPTYGYVLAFDGAGDYLGLSAEQAQPDWPAETQRKVVRADPNAMARIVEAIRADRPMNLQGVCWFRLPTDADWLNWHWPTLSAVMAGRPPRRDCRVVAATTTGRELYEVHWRNDGEADAPLGMAVTIRARRADAEVFDAGGQGGYAWQPAGRGSGRFVPGPRLEQAVVKPGRVHPIGWIRFTRDTEVTTDARHLDPP
ncbi:MAG: DUF3142 domain-containing protein, partial [Alphaproteobacteria bacterium]|nr:DUF3142 domain-containing protein [Alphaproteobacteria bacterium]